MGSKLTDPPTDPDLASDEDIQALYEQVRAAERDPSIPAPLAHASMEVHLDWDSLQKWGLHASVPERVHDAVSRWSDSMVAATGLLPLMAVYIALEWMRRTSFTIDTAVFFAAAFVFFALMVLWLALAARAMKDALSYRAKSLAYALGAIAAAAFLVYVGVNLRSPKSAAEVLTVQAREAFENDDVKTGLETVEEVTRQTTPSENLGLWFKNAETVYRQVMRARNAEELEKLASKAIDVLTQAAQTDPDNAAIWTRLAEVHQSRGDIASARNAIDKVKELEAQKKNVPDAELERARQIDGIISVAEINAQLAQAPDSETEKREVAARLDLTIKRLTDENKQAPNVITVQLLTQLCLQKVAIAETEQERQSAALCAAEANQTVLSSRVMLRNVDPPKALAATDTDNITRSQ